MIEHAMTEDEIDAVMVGAAHLVDEIGRPSTEREAWLLAQVAVTAAAAVAASHMGYLAASDRSRDQLARYWGDELANRIRYPLAGAHRPVSVPSAAGEPR